MIAFPAWDCLPYDRVSPIAEIVGRRLDALVRLAAPGKPGRKAAILLTTVGALLQQVPPRGVYAGRALTVRARASRLDVDGAARAISATTATAAPSTVREPGEFAVRGGIIDLFPPRRCRAAAPRLLRRRRWKRIRAFDPATPAHHRPARRAHAAAGQRGAARRRQRSSASAPAIASCSAPSPATIRSTRPCQRGQRYAGMEHWLPLFYERLETLFDYLPDAPVVARPPGRRGASTRACD